MKKKKKATATATRNKDTHFQGQYIRTLKAFSGYPKTMLQVSKETEILRANICRYVADMRKHDLIEELFKGLCPISKFRAGFYISKRKEVDNG